MLVSAQMKTKGQTFEQKLRKLFETIFNIQVELDKGISYSMKIENEMLSVKVNNLRLLEDHDEIYFEDYDYEITADCKLSKFIGKVSPDCFYQYFDAGDFMNKLNKTLFGKSLNALNKELQKNKEFDDLYQIINIFWETNCPNIEKHWTKFLARYNKYLKNVEDDKKQRADSIFLRGYWIPRSEIAKALKSKTDDENV